MNLPMMIRTTENMRKRLRAATMLTALMVSIGVPLYLIQASNTVISMQISAGSISISSPAGLAFAANLNTSAAIQVMEQEFTGSSNYFYVDDMKGSNTGYTTTLQLSGDMVAGSNAIGSGSISFKSTSGSVDLISGISNPNVLIDSNATTYQALNSAKTFIYRSNGANTGAIGQYGQNIRIRINVPAYQAPGAYTVTLVFTLIEN